MRVRWYSSSSAGVSRCPRRGALRGGAGRLGPRHRRPGARGRPGAPGPGSPRHVGERTAESGSRTAEAAQHGRGDHGDQRGGGRAAAAPRPARSQRPWRRGGRRAARPARERAGAICLGRVRPRGRLRRPLAPAARPAPGPHRPSWGSRTPAGGAGLGGPQPRPGPRLPAITQGARARGGAAAHLAESRTPGQGAVPASQPLIPALRRRVPRAGRAARVFPAHPQITPHPNRHPRDRWRRRRASHGAWPRVDWLLGARGGVTGGFHLKMAPVCGQSQRKGTPGRCGRSCSEGASRAGAGEHRPVRRSRPGNLLPPARAAPEGPLGRESRCARRVPGISARAPCRGLRADRRRGRGQSRWIPGVPSLPCGPVGAPNALGSGSFTGQKALGAGCPRGGRAGLLPPRLPGHASLSAEPEARPCTVTAPAALAARDQQD